jgi:hypothetical protein
VITMDLSRARTLAAALRRIVDGLVIAGALAATALAFVAAVALFVMVGKLSHRREAVGASPATTSLPAGPYAGPEGSDRS